MKRVPSKSILKKTTSTNSLTDAGFQNIKGSVKNAYIKKINSLL